MSNSYEYFLNKKTDKIYSPKGISWTEIIIENGKQRKINRPIKYLSGVIDCNEKHEFIKQGERLKLRVTQGERQEIVAKIYEDTRGIITLKINKYNTKSGNPYQGEWTLVGDEIIRLANFINSVPFLPLKQNETQQFTDNFLKKHLTNKEQILRFLAQYPDIITEIQTNNITNLDIALIKRRKESLQTFEKMLSNNDTNELEWQKFFENNTWIFGYGLNYVFNSPLEGKVLEQTISGYSVTETGKRVDALMKRRGIINSICMIEIKKHNAKLLREKTYRPSTYEIADEVRGGIAQVQKTLQKSIENIRAKLTPTDKYDNSTGEIIFNYQPKAYLIIGSLDEFTTESGINQEKFSSFELFRRNLWNPEIITYDELYERAKFIVSTDI